MKKQAYLTPQIKVVRMKMSKSVMMTVSNIQTIQSKGSNNDDIVGIGWENDADNTGEAF